MDGNKKRGLGISPHDKLNPSKIIENLDEVKF